MLDAGYWMKSRMLRKFSIKYRASSITRNLPPVASGEPLRHEKNFTGIWVLHLRAGGESFNIYIFAGREWTFHHVRLPGNWNAVRMIALSGAANRSGCGRGHRRRHFRRRRGGTWRVRIKWLLLRRVRRWFSDGISPDAVTRSWRRFLFAGCNHEASQQKNRQQRFHRHRLETKLSRLLFVAND